MSIIKRGELKDRPHKLREIAPSGSDSERFESLFPQNDQDGLYHQKSGASFPKVERADEPARATDPNTVAQKQLKLFADLIDKSIT